MVLLKVKYINVFKNFRETAKTGFYFAAKGVRKASVLSERIKLTYVPTLFSEARAVPERKIKSFFCVRKSLTAYPNNLTPSASPKTAKPSNSFCSSLFKNLPSFLGLAITETIYSSLKFSAYARASA